MLLSDSNHITLVVGKARLLPSAPRISNHEYMNIVSPSVRAWQLGNTHPSLNYYYQLLDYCTLNQKHNIPVDTIPYIHTNTN